MPNEQGKLIADRYRLEREIARGGMGSVWAASDSKLRRSVAVKLMVSDWTASTDACTRFEREAMAAARLQSPHVVQIFDYGVEDQQPYIVMELLDGEDLRQRLKRQESLPLEEVSKILVQTAKALSEAHGAGLVHRDLKPGNIFLARSREEELVKVLDFGVAKADPGTGMLSTDTKEGSILGTPQYMAPEQARALPDVDFRADLWSLGVIAYRALMGKLPFIGKSAADVIVKICTQAVPPVWTERPDLPSELDQFFKRALAKKREKRFQSAKEMAQVFTDIAPTSFPSLSMPGQRSRLSAWDMFSSSEPLPGEAPPSLYWEDEDDDEPTSVSQSRSASRRSGPPPLPSSKPEPMPIDAALLASGSTDPLGLFQSPGPDSGISDSGASSGSISGSISQRLSSPTLGSGLVDASTAPKPAPNGKRRAMMITIGALAVLGVAAVLGSQIIGSDAATAATDTKAAASTARVLPPAPAPTPSATAAPADTGSAQTAPPASSAAASASASAASAAASESAAPQPVVAPRPQVTPLPKPTKPDTKTSDPFSERL